MLKLRKLATVFLTSLVIFAWSLPVNDVHSLSTTEVTTGLILDGGFDVVPDGAGNFYIFSYDKGNKQTVIAKFDTSTLTSLGFYNSSDNTMPLKSLGHGYEAVYYSNSPSTITNTGNDSLNLFYVDSGNHFVQYRYPTKTTQQTYGWQKINNMEINLGDIKPEKQNTAVGANGDIFIFTSNSTSVDAYNASGKVDNTELTVTDGPIAAIATDTSDNYLYAATNNALYRYKISEGSYEFEKTAISGNFAPLKFLTDNIFITSATTPCKICILNDSEFKLDSSVDMQATMENYPDCVAIAGFDNASILAKTAEKVVSRIRCSDGYITGKFEFGEKILAVATSGDKTIVVTGTTTATNIHLITASDITEITPPEPENPPEIGGGTNPDIPNPDTPPETPDDTTIESTEGYEVGENVISKIPAGTTLGALKNGLTFNGSLVLKDSGGNTKTAASTKIATGYTVTFVNDGAEYKKFTLVVEGDVTGSGNISTKSISALANHLLGKTELEGVYKDAANLSGDGDLSTVDLLLMYKQTQK